MFIVHFARDEDVAVLARLFRTYRVHWPAHRCIIKQVVPQPSWIGVMAGKVRAVTDTKIRITETDGGPRG